MTPEQLMQPRYMVIADYPGIEDETWSIGDIIAEENMGATVNPFYKVGRFGFINESHVYRPEKYPAIFRPMPWYEGRKVEDMPEYLKFTERGKGSEYVLKVYKYAFNTPPGKSCFYPEKDSLPYYLENFEIATEAEYISHINKTV